MKTIDNFLNRTTMYKLVTLGLGAEILMAIILGFFGKVPYSPIQIIVSTIFFVAVCLLSNRILGKIFKATTNDESAYTSALILVLLFSPSDVISNLMGFGLIAVLAMISKFILSVWKKHIFNPVALVAVIAPFIIGIGARWWVGTAFMLPITLIVGYLVTKKVKRFDLVISFIVTVLIMISINTVYSGGDLIKELGKNLFLDTAIIFFSTIMLTEPATTPPDSKRRIGYGILTGLMFPSFVNIFGFYFTPELVLVIGNIYSWIVSPKKRLILVLKEKISLAKDCLEFRFSGKGNFDFKAGQYMEFTLGAKKPDNRGIRRYFTISSAPKDNDLAIGIKFYDNGSSFKKELSDIKIGDTLSASSLSGDFVLPKEKNKKLVWIAGGIGITPFISMARQLSLSNEKRDVVLFYSNKTEEEIAYRSELDSLKDKIGLKVVYNLSDLQKIRAGWGGSKGFVDTNLIKNVSPDFVERTFYISGPNSMADHFKDVLVRSGVKSSQVITDFFPGFA